MIPMDVEFESKLANIRLDLHAAYSMLYHQLGANRDPVAAFRVLGQLVDQRNVAGPSLADEDYFKFDNLKHEDVAAFVLEGCLDEVDWLSKAEKQDDIENRLHWVCEQEQALMVDDKDYRSDRKLCTLKGRFLVLWNCLVRLGMFNPGEPPRDDRG